MFFEFESIHFQVSNALSTIIIRYLELEIKYLENVSPPCPEFHPLKKIIASCQTSPQMNRAVLFAVDSGHGGKSVDFCGNFTQIDFREFLSFLHDFWCKMELKIYIFQIKSFLPPSLVFYPPFLIIRVSHKIKFLTSF